MPDLALNLSPIAGFNLDLEQYAGLWLVDETRFGAMLDQVSRMDLATHVAANVGRPIIQANSGMVQVGDYSIAVLHIEGTMTKRGSSLSGAGSSILLRDAVRRAGNNSSIAGLVLHIDSPGGTVAGTADLASEVAAAAKKKPVWTFAEDCIASAAYWVGSQTSRIYANNGTALVGSIGTFMGLYDCSGAATMQGYKAVVIRSGSLKGAGFPGTEITKEQQDAWQDIVDKTQAQFSQGVAEGRKLTLHRVSELATGQTWTAADAQKEGLIDGIMSFDEMVSEMAADIQRRTPRKKGKAMSDHVTPQAATYAELKAACPGSDAGFLCNQLEAGATTEAAVKGWMGTLTQRLDAAVAAKDEAEKDRDKHKEDADKAKAARSGVAPLGSGRGTTNSESDPVKAWDDAIKEARADGMTKAQAVRKVAVESKDLHQAYIEAVNAKR